MKLSCVELFATPTLYSATCPPKSGLRICFQPLRAASAAIFDRSRSFARADPAGGCRYRTAGFGCLSHLSGA
jgi:hypothetical protein